MTDYQSLSKYSGTLYGQPRYNGISYSWEVPDNLVVGSPGGVDSVRHHWTKGFNGRGNTSSDIYAGQGPRYISGVYGNLYQQGQEAGQHMGYYPAAPDYQHWQNQEPQEYDYSTSVSSLWDPVMTKYGEPGSYMEDPKKKEVIEDYTPNEDFELVEPSDDDVPQSSNIAIIFVVLLVLFIVCYFWSQSGFLFVKQYLHNGKTPQWTRMIFYSIILTILFAILFYFSGVSSTTFEVK